MGRSENCENFKCAFIRIQGTHRVDVEIVSDSTHIGTIFLNLHFFLFLCAVYIFQEHLFPYISVAYCCHVHFIEEVCVSIRNEKKKGPASTTHFTMIKNFHIRTSTLLCDIEYLHKTYPLPCMRVHSPIALSSFSMEKFRWKSIKAWQKGKNFDRFWLVWSSFKCHHLRVASRNFRTSHKTFIPLKLFLSSRLHAINLFATPQSLKLLKWS